jgi:iron complex transport system ATP-binding protein
MAHQLEVLTLLQQLNRTMGVTVLIVMHELNNAIKFADHIIGMKKGGVVFSGAPSEVVTKESLKILYDIAATLQMDSSGSYPVCTDYELIG